MSTRTPSPIGLRLQEARKLADLPARELDRLAKTTEGHASLIESGVVDNMKLNTLGKLAGVLGVTMGWLIDGAGKPPTARSVQVAVDAARAARAVEDAAKAESGDRAAHASKRTGTGR